MKDRGNRSLIDPAIRGRWLDPELHESHIRAVMELDSLIEQLMESQEIDFHLCGMIESLRAVVASYDPYANMNPLWVSSPN